jgi:two-component system, NarL family, sensor kinase
MKGLITILFLIFTAFSLAQKSEKVSWQKMLEAKDYEEQKNRLIELCEIYRFTNPDSCLLSAELLIKQAIANKDIDGKAQGSLYRAIYINQQGKLQEAFDLAETAIEEATQQKKVQPYYAKLYAISGNSLMRMNKQKEAVEKFYKALEIAENSEDADMLMRANINIGWAFMELHQTEKAIAFFRNAIQIIRNNQLPDKFPVVYNNLASCYGDIKKFDSCYKYASIGINLAKKMNNAADEANGLNIMGTFLTQENKYSDALAYFKASQPLRNKIGDPFYIVSDMSVLADLYGKMGKADTGIQTALSAIKIAKEKKIDAKMPMLLKSLALNYELAGKSTEALEVYKQLNKLQDSIYIKANPAALAKVQALYEKSQQEKKIQEQDFQIIKRNFWIAGISISIILLSLLAFSFYKKMRLQQAANLQQAVALEREQSAKAILEAEEKERIRIATELHDGVGQMMSAAKMNLSALENEIPFENKEQKIVYEKAISLVDESCNEVRAISHNMVPNALQQQLKIFYCRLINV